MKFLHTGDLHLDSAFCRLGALGAEQRREGQRKTLKRIFDIAVAEECDAILIAGDMFDTAFVTPETRKLCLELFSDFKKPIIISPGNHDPYIDGGFYKNTAFPENVYVFSSSELQRFDFPSLNVSVLGYAFTSPTLPFNPLVESRSEDYGLAIRLLCAHCDLNTPTSRYAPILVSDMERYGFSYAALGHIHNVEETEATVRYCGFPEGRSFDELGEGGVCVVTVNADGDVSVERRATSEQRYERLTVEVGELTDAFGVEALVAAAADKLVAKKVTAARIRLEGVLPEGVSLELGGLRDKYSDLGLYIEIEDATLSLPDKSFLEKDPSLRGEFYRSLRDSLYSRDPDERKQATLALRIGLAAIEGKSFAQGGAYEDN